MAGITTMERDHARCRELEHPNITNFSISLFIVLGILISYLPQHYKIISRRSSRGLSPLFVLLGMVSATASIANILTLPESTRDMACCAEIEAFPCAAALLGVAQLGVQWTCFFFIVLLFLIFFPRDPSPPSERDTSLPTWKEAVLVLALSLTFFFAVLLLSLIFAYALPSHLRAWAITLGLLGTLFAAIQYFPQIAMTWRLQETGSLSVPMMCIQTPGSFVFAGSLAARLGAGGWSAWGLFIFTGCLQGVLLGMSFWFMWRDRKAAKGTGNGALHSGDGNGGARVDERTPLLNEEEEEEGGGGGGGGGGGES